MEVYNFASKNSNYDFSKLDAILKEGQELGLDVSELISKIDEVKRTLSVGVTKIVLLGSFSDGKTSVIAALLGRLEDSMKIDNDESSDELTIYRPDGLREGFEIVDTPGLFGTKEKEIDGQMVKFSSITEKYISEAHIVIYVCGAVNPIKQSHIPVLKRVLRDYNKLPNTIFVINKMDAVCDVLDEEEFCDAARIRKENLRTRFQNEINLSKSETDCLNIACIAADPKGKGLKYWFAKSDDYMERSHIGDLRKVLDSVVDNSDVSELQNSSVLASVKDVVSSVGKTIEYEILPLNKALDSCEFEQKHLHDGLDRTEKSLKTNRDDLFESLTQFKDFIVSEISNANYETIGSVVETHLGIQDKKVSFYLFIAKINLLIKSCTESNVHKMSKFSGDIEVSFKKQNQMVQEGLKTGMKAAKGLNISNKTVLAARNLIAPAVKFKPYGAVNLAKNISKGIAIAGVVLDIGMAIYDWWQKKKKTEECEILKEDLKGEINNFFASIFEEFNSDDAYYKNYAPAYLELKKQVEERDQEIADLKSQLNKLGMYKAKLDKFYGSDIKDVEWEEA